MKTLGILWVKSTRAKMAYLYVLLIGLILTSTSTIAQDDMSVYIDSLRDEIEIQKGISKAEVQLELANTLFEIDNLESQELANTVFRTATETGNKKLELQSSFLLGRINHEIDNIEQSQQDLYHALEIANELDDNWYRAEIMLRVGINLHMLGQRIEALETYTSAIHFGEEAENYRIVGAVYSVLGNVYSESGLYDRAIENIIKSRLNYEKAGFKEGNAWDNYLLGYIYFDLEMPDRAREYFEESLHEYEELAAADNNKTGVAICLVQIGRLDMTEGNFDKAREKVGRALEIYRESSSNYGIASAINVLGRIEFEAGDCEKAVSLLETALREKQRIGDQLSQPGVYEYLGLCQYKTGNPEQGIATILKGLELARSNNQKQTQVELLRRVTTIYTELDRIQEAFQYQNQLIALQDSLRLGDVSLKMEQLQEIYEAEARNEQIAELQKQNEINELEIRQHRNELIFLISGILAAILLAAILFYFNRQMRKKNIELQESNATKDKFFSIIAHDLRSPVHNITAFLDLIHSDFNQFEKADLKRILEKMHKTAVNLGELVDNLLRWAHLQTNQIKFNPEKINVFTAVHNSFAVLKSMADDKNIEVDINIDDQLFVLADQNMMDTIIRNLVNNALKFTNEGGNVQITANKTDKNLVGISIIDNGVGISPDDLAKIFDSNFHYHTSGTQSEKGSGLGLNLVNDFVKKNGGNISIESELGKGTKLTFTIPKA